MVTYYTQADQIVALLERGDIVIAPWYIDLVGAAAAKGVPVALAFPEEGAIRIIPTVSIPRTRRTPRSKPIAPASLMLTPTTIKRRAIASERVERTAPCSRSRDAAPGMEVSAAVVEAASYAATAL